MKTIKNNRLSTLCASIAFLLGSSALAGTATANMSVSATVSNSCTISTTALAFGAFSPTSGQPGNGTSSVSVTCTQDAPLSIMLGEGSYADAASSPDAPLRRMNFGTSYLNYELYQDAALTTLWGDSSNSGKGSIGTGSAENHTVYAKIPSGQNVPAGAYADTLLATVSF
ncbi:Csu type fimbrial protein [Hyalangium gracile]|uniref:Csu type fimbrial protein n=1 Tax=Hyalangium gracile TaxID=394092 RepID=UPI001CCA0F73|nr:spore coat U domain-containing protein [Hyalangium gracile]